MKKTNKAGPDFIVIGVGRCGTTWLYENLKRCESIWLPPVKELHYFDRSIRYPTLSHLNDKYFLRRLLGREYYNKQFRLQMIRRIGKCLLNFNVPEMVWCLRYYFGTINTDWYLSLFQDGENQISGDITPSYHLLNSSEVRKIYNILPEAKILLIIRDPIHRTWSQLRKNGQTKWPYHEIQKKLESDDIKLRNNYLYAIKNWKKYYPQNQFKLLFYDDIIQSPNIYLNSILSFLSIEVHELPSTLIEKKLNSAPSVELDIKVGRLIAESSLSDLKMLCKEIGGYSIKWLDEAESLLKSDTHTINI